MYFNILLYWGTRAFTKTVFVFIGNVVFHAVVSLYNWKRNYNLKVFWQFCNIGAHFDVLKFYLFSFRLQKCNVMTEIQSICVVCLKKKKTSYVC